ncbi:MAG: MgtC/SapB family protein [Ruminococcaceae bacterium]|nr:MgtC/SapB family protein [Oscillospiraceae bacterium]
MDFIRNATEYLQEINYASIVLRIVLAVVFGGIIGFERGRHGSQAGMRTHILVCLGGMMTALVGVYCNQVLGYDNDPLRIAAQVVSGIGFLGAGMIIVKSDKMITGLTTAAIMWTTAIIGISLGIGFYSGAFLAMLACLFTAAFLTRIERKRRKTSRIYIEVSDLPSLGKITEQIKMLLPDDCHAEITPPKSGMAGHLGIYIITTSLKDVESFRNDVESMNGIHFIIFE